MISISCPTKFWAFAQAEEFHKHGMLGKLFTAFAAQKHPILKNLIRGRVDQENIPPKFIQTYLAYAVKAKLKRKPVVELNEEFDQWVARQLVKSPEFSVFIGWAGISLNSIRAARSLGKTTIIERGSSHILFQKRLLSEEFARFNLKFTIDQAVIDKEMQEYEEVDFISIPSQFVKRSFIEMGVPESKLVVNPYGSPNLFKPVLQQEKARPFRILYMGSISVRKGIKYLLDALTTLDFPYEAWFLGSCDAATRQLIEAYDNPNVKLWGHIEQSQLPGYISACDVFVMPSIEDGFGMVIPQAISCGIPVVTTHNTGGADILDIGKTGFVVPVRDSDAISEKITRLFRNPELLAEMKMHCRDKRNHVTWDDYGKKYVAFIKTISNK